MKILLLSHNFYPDIGGIETISEILAQKFFEAGHEVQVVTWSLDATGKVFPYKVIRNPGIVRLIKEHLWADLTFENNICIRLAWPKIFFGKPSVIGLQTWINRKNGKVGWVDRLKLKWLKQADKVICCSNAIRNRCCPDSLVIGNPYQENVFKFIPDIPRTSDFIFLGRLVSDKGADFAIQAFHDLKNENKEQNLNFGNLSLTIVGDGPERKNLKSLVIKLGLEKSVVFKGALRGKELVANLNQHQILLVPSLWEEPFGIVALEGMACGCLPIVSDGGGLPDAVGNAGLIFKSGNIDDLVFCMKHALNNQSLVHRLRMLAKEHLTSHCSDEVSRMYLSLIEEAIS